MNKKTIKDLKNLKNKVVLLRVDFNVPLKNNVVQSSARIEAALPTINYLLEQEAKIVIFSHLGRIKGEEDKRSKTMSPVAEKLKEFVDTKIIFVPETRGEILENSIKELNNREILVFENTRFEDFVDGKEVKRESKNNPELGKYWASLGDVFVNDAFGTAHRSHASNVGIAKNIKESAVGLLIEKEVKFLHDAIQNPKRPMVSLLGGAKVSDKINVIESLAKKSDKVIIGTAMCYTFHLAMGKKIGNSLAEPEKIDLAKELMEKYGDKLIIAEDSIVASEFKDVKGKKVDEIPDWMIGMDIGPKSLKKIKKELKDAKTVIWNGPFGVSEFENFKHGSEKIANILVSLKDATTIIGGGDSAAMAIKMGLEDKFTHISTGGGASMEFLEGKVLPGIDVIDNK